MARRPAPRLRSLGFDIDAALERLELPMVVIDRNGTILWLNDEALEAFGHAVGRSFVDYVAPESLRTVQESFAKKLLGGRRATHYPARLQLATGEELSVEISSAALEDDGQIVGVFGLLVPKGEPQGQLSTVDLTPRQLEVLRRLAAGATTERIGDDLHISVATVRNHVRDLLKRMGVHTRLEAVLRAHELGLV